MSYTTSYLDVRCRIRYCKKLRRRQILTVLATFTYDIVRHIVYDIVRKTYDVVYDIVKTYDIVGVGTVLAIFTYDIVYDIVGFYTMSYVISYVNVSIIRCLIR
jgi:hypothetical protein